MRHQREQDAERLERDAHRFASFRRRDFAQRNIDDTVADAHAVGRPRLEEVRMGLEHGRFGRRAPSLSGVAGGTDAGSHGR
jgi:hypothetical protein